MKFEVDLLIFKLILIEKRSLGAVFFDKLVESSSELKEETGLFLGVNRYWKKQFVWSG